jgi:peroxiredoxin
MLALGTPAPDFELQDVVSGKTVTLDSFSGRKAFLLMFLSPHCPYVQHVQNGVAALGREYAARDVGIVAVSSNDAAQYPDDAPEGLRKMAAKLGFEFPFCFDETQAVAKAYHAACTPEFYLFDSGRLLVYRGQFDDSRRYSEIPVTGKHLRAALDAVLAGRPVERNQVPSIGCNVKWKPGNEPAYYRTA